MTKCTVLKQPYNLKTSRIRTLPSHPTGGIFTKNQPTALTRFPMLKSSRSTINFKSDLLSSNNTVYRSSACSRCRNILKSLAPKWSHSSNSQWKSKSWNQKMNPLSSAAMSHSWESLQVFTNNQSSSINVLVRCIWLWSMPPIKILKALKL